MKEAEHFLSVAVKAARVGGRILMKHYGKLKATDVIRKGKTDWVTRIDHLSEEAIIGVIRSAFPQHTVKAEESIPQVATSTYQWLIDPLDGTSNYIHRFPAFCISIALVKQGRLQVGVVYDPLRKELFTASRGGGAFLNGRPIRVSRHRKLSDCLLTTGFPARAQERLDLYLETFRRIFRKTGIIRRAGSAALDLAFTACGRSDGFWEMGLSDWDMAAGALLIQEAGGRVSDFLGKQEYLVNGNITAANPAIHAQLVRILRSLFQVK